MSRKFWLLKTEPTSFSIDMLAACRGQTTCWDGVRNYQARNMLRDELAVGDGVFIYHSRLPPVAIAGTAKVVRAGYPDPSQHDPDDDHYDPMSPADAPRWFAVDIRLEEVFARPVTRADMRAVPQLAELMVLRQGSRLSVQPVSAAHWATLCRMGRGEGPRAGA